MPNTVVIRDLGNINKETVCISAVPKNHPVASEIPAEPILDAPLENIAEADGGVMLCCTAVITHVGTIESTKDKGDVVVITIRDATAKLDVTVWMDSLDLTEDDLEVDRMCTLLNFWATMEEGKPTKCCNLPNKSSFLFLDSTTEAAQNWRREVDGTDEASLLSLKLQPWGCVLYGSMIVWMAF